MMKMKKREALIIGLERQHHMADVATTLRAQISKPEGSGKTNNYDCNL